LSTEHILELLEKQDIFILTSEFEGLPMSLLEAMGRGCVPIVTDISSGIPRLIKNDLNGYKIPIGDVKQFVEKITYLYYNENIRLKMAENAYKTIKNNGYTIENMTNNYYELFNNVMEEIQKGQFKRPGEDILPPDYIRNSSSYMLEKLIQNIKYKLLGINK